MITESGVYLYNRLHNTSFFIDLTCTDTTTYNPNRFKATTIIGEELSAISENSDMWNHSKLIYATSICPTNQSHPEYFI